MAHITYRVVEHDGGWAYTLDGTYSETFSSHEAARGAAVRAAREQKVPDQNAVIEYETSGGKWVTESADGHDRPETEVQG
ncbi:DUF2188 domain-containing protein [Brevundimonas nasdae]|uniref:DUF2188 domain-containing protein n=1 Tax=Brevundimonas nasdae TaxID=172043 RepID=UPI002896A9CF|nr:DUF2188 domain-containing protein [Brevundimonas nasdae]